MPNRDQHLRQAGTNARLLADLQLRGIDYPDWVIVVAFYTALHAVDGHLDSRGVHPKKHSERNSEVARDVSLRAVSPDYLRLYWESRRARYDCSVMGPNDAQRALQNMYEPVRARLCSLLGVTL